MNKFKKIIISICFFVCSVCLFSLNAEKAIDSNDSPKDLLKPVYVVNVEGVIDPVVARYVNRAINRAEEENAQCLIIQMDTPGGLVESMRTIVLKMENSSIPIVVYITPIGARAASAGVFITMASDVAVMAPGTHIGSAHPVSMGKKMDEEMVKKAVNDLVSFIINRAKSHKRNEEWAENSVRESVSVTVEEALTLKVVDFQAKDFKQLLEKLEGREIVKKDEKSTLHPLKAVIKYLDMTFRERFLHTLANPNIAYILMIFGIYGIIYEFHSPGVGFAGTVGGVCLILAFFSLQILPVNLAGVFLIILGIVFLILELWITSYGILAMGGIVSFVIGSFILVDSPESAEFYRISVTLILSLAVTTFLFFAFAISAALKLRRSKPVTGKEGFIGKIGYAKTKIAPEGMVFVEGEYWSAQSEEGVIQKGEKVEVISIAGQLLKVKKI